MLNESKLPISVQICTLNEEENIKDCLEKVSLNSISEILVIDANSNDNTRNIASALAVNVINAGRIGLANQRQIGIMNTDWPYIAIVDADDRLEKDCLSKLLHEMEENNFDAIQANVQSLENLTYWQTAWGLFCSLNINTAGKTNMVGRPALFKTEAIKKIGFDNFFTYGSEDTDISYRFEKNNYIQGIGTGKSFRIHPRTFKECYKKWYSYGRGYARFVYKFPEKKKNIIRHLLWTIPFSRSKKIVFTKNFKFIFFNLLYGHITFVGFTQEFLRLKFRIFKVDFGR